MEGTDSASPPSTALLHDVFLHLQLLLPPNALALDGRLICKDAAQRLVEPPQRTACISQPLPGHVHAATEGTVPPWWLEGAQAALRELTFRRKLLLLSRAAASGCEANVEFALQLLQPHVFQELLHTDCYTSMLASVQHSQLLSLGGASHDGTDFERFAGTPGGVGAGAVVSGLAHLLPSLEQRCPGLLDPWKALEAAADRLDLAGLQAVWEVVSRRLHGSLEPDEVRLPSDLDWDDRVEAAWSRVAAAAAKTRTPDAGATLTWVVEKARLFGCYSLLRAPFFPELRSRIAGLCGAAAGSCDMARLEWLREQGFEWRSGAVLKAVLWNAPLDFIQRLEQEGCYLPPAGNGAWTDGETVAAAACSPQDTVAKLRWLAARGAALGGERALQSAAEGSVDALRLVLEHWRRHNGDGVAPPATALACAVRVGNVPAASLLRQAGCPLEETAMCYAFGRGDLPMVRWLLGAGCPRGQLGIGKAAQLWPSSTSADSKQLVEAVRLLAAAGWPVQGEDGEHPFTLAARGKQPWLVWRALLELLPAEDRQSLPLEAVKGAAATGCHATLEALVGLGVYDVHGGQLAAAWYAAAAANGDHGTLECLRRLGVPLGEGALLAAVRQEAPLPALRWLVEQGAPLGGREVQDALEAMKRYCFSSNAGRKAQRQEMRKWLRGMEGRTAAAGGGQGQGHGSRDG